MVSSFSGSGTSQITVNLTGVTNVQRITVTLHNVNDGTSNGDVSVSMGVLVGDVNGYSASPASGSINVSGSGATQSVVFVLNVPTGDDPGVSPGFLGLPGYDGFYLLAGAVGVAAFVAAVALTAPPRGPKPGPSTPSNR
jgi:hypothetical protein